MNNNLYNEHTGKQKNMLLIFASIILIVVGYVTMNMGIFDKVSKINVNIDKKIVYEGEEKDLKVKVKTNGNFDPVVKFRSSSGKVEFSEEVQYGEEIETKITGLKPGRDTLVIDAGKELNKKEKTEEIEILVCEKPIIKNTSDKIINIKEDEKIELRFNVTRECLEGYQIYVENEEIAEIDEDYNLIGKKKGTTKIILKGDNTKTSYSLNVGTTIINVKSVVISEKSLNIEIGKIKKITVNVLPSNATNRKVRYISSNESIATVTKEGKVAGIKVGTTTIRVITEDGSKTASVKVKVYKPTVTPPEPPTPIAVKNIKFGSSSYTIALNETKKLTLGIEPTNATNKTITCKSQNTSIVEVSASGNVCTIKGKKAGTAKIEAYSVDGNKKATTTIEVKPISVKSISFGSNSYNMYVGNSLTLEVKFNPTNASNKTISCTSSDKSIATVSAKGSSCIVNGVKSGTATITATTNEGSKTASTTIKVNNILVTGIKFASSSYSVNEGSTKALTATVSPSNATNQKYTCTSSNTGVATITSGCTVKGVKAGTATITATTEDGNKTAATTVTVKKTIKKVTIKVASFNVGYFACGSYSGANCRPTPQNISDLIKKYKIDIVGMQEARDLNTADYSTGCGFTLYGIKAIRDFLKYDGYVTCPRNVNAILSKYTFKSKTMTRLDGTGERRSLDKVVVNINGVDISFYNSHLGLSSDNEKHFAAIAEIVKNDPNPVIMTADWNYTYISRFNKYFIEPSDMKFKIAAYDTTTHNMWGRTSYCDAVLVKSKGHIDIGSSQTVDTFNSYSDHNMVIATLKVY